MMSLVSADHAETGMLRGSTSRALVEFATCPVVVTVR